MKKLLVLMSVMLLFGVTFVMATEDSNPQDGGGDVNVDYTVNFPSGALDFGGLIPGASGSQPNQVSVGTSPLVMMGITVEPDAVGGIFNSDNVQFSLTDADFVPIDEFLNEDLSIATHGVLDFFVEMTIPVGTLSGPYAGTITYTVMEDIV
jgi:hypothetical protein